MKIKPLYYKREFLNQTGEQSIGFIFVKLDKGNPKESWFEAPDFIIGDCNKTIRLDFSANDKDAAVNALKKVDLLFETIRDFRRALHKAVKTHAKQQEWDLSTTPSKEPETTSVNPVSSKVKKPLQQ